MTFNQHPYINCDWSMCYLESRDDLRIYNSRAAQIRAELATRGWRQILGLDFCDHHPDLEQHVPALTTETSLGIKGLRTKGLRASCSCGWRDTQHSWAPERKTAIERWKRHLPEEEGCFKKIRKIRYPDVP